MEENRIPDLSFVGKERPEWYDMAVIEVEEANILVVDGEKAGRELLTQALIGAGYDVTSVGTGERALKLLAVENYSLLITDLVMPGMDGIELLLEVKKQFPKMDVMVTTDYATVETAVESMRLGAVDYISRPYNIELVKLVVEQALELRQLRRKAELAEYYLELARIDGLTGLYNYRFFLELLDAELSRSNRQSHPVSLLLFDIDHFKVYNDHFGHLAGDLALRQVSGVLAENTRVYDSVARYGGEEFVIIAPDTDKDEAADIGARLVETVDRTYIADQEQLPAGRFTISAGLATYPLDATDWKSLIEAADSALYGAKQAGGNQLVAYSADEA